MDMPQATPVSAEVMVCQALRAATNGNHEIVRKAEAQLLEWETQPGFFPTLTRISLAVVGGLDPSIVQQLDVNVRWMAVVYLKNGINKYWRKGARQELSPEEKQQIRDLLLMQFANEPIPQVSLQIAVLMARIARIDCPHDWPQLVPELLKRLQTFSTNARCESLESGEQQRVLLTLHHVIKALASRRLWAEKRVFEELTNNIYDFIYQLWDTYCTLFFHQLKEAQQLAKPTLEISVLCTRILRKLTIYGYMKIQSTPGCLRFVEKLFERLKQCLIVRYELRQLNADEQLVGLLEKLILKQMKTLLEFTESHAVAFKNFVPMALQFTFDHVFHVSAYLIFTDNVINFRQFAIHCINLMKGLMSPFYWQKIDNYLDNDNSQDLEIRSSLETFFTEERLSYMCEKIITHYFILTQIELDLWLEDPEEFAQDDSGGDTWKYALRPCIETLFMVCVTNYTDQMSAEVVKYVQKAQQIQLTANSDLKDILLKDAIYNAAGQASLHLFNELDFDAWFSGQLLNELKIDSINFRILKRRIICLLGEWAGVNFSRDLRPLAYEACLHLLRPAEDMSIRLASSSTLSILISDFDFAPEAFLPYLEPSFNALFVLLREAKECDTKMKVLAIMSSLVEKMSDNIEPYADSLISYLPLLWKESEDYSMLRCAIICTLQQVVKAIRDIPEKMLPFLYSVIALSTDLQEPSHIYLIEEGLSLWVAVVENSTSMSAPLIDLCRNILPIIEMSSENLRTVLVLIQAYILLDANAYLERYGRPFVDFCNRMFDDIRPEGIILMVKVLEICLKTDTTNGLELVRPVLPYIFKQVYANKDFPMLMGMYLTMVARVLLISQQVFMEVIQELQQPNALETILDVWITKMPLVTELEKIKLFSLAFLSIFSNNPILLDRFPAIMQNISDALFEVMREDDDGQNQHSDDPNAAIENKPIKYCDSLVFADEYDLDTSSYCTMDDFDYKTYHYDRCRQLSLKDPVHKIALPQYIEWQLGNLRTQLGDDAYQQLMRSLYPAVLERFAQFVNLQITFPTN
ncbi:importin-11 [Stomoxys calcitrans]|uniref:importin-11 n=1 Tax=Stomoxys calcitrans TaxID=35570 RepID=UPI0027E27D69|nr:importin-11 [Stomoxys calcitrans]